MKPLDIFKYIRCSQHLGNFDELVVIVDSFEERFALKHHACQHAACTPEVQLVVVVSHAHEKLWPFVEPRGDSAVQLLAWGVEISETPVCNSYLPSRVIHEHVVRLDVTMDDAFRVRVLQAQQSLQDERLNIFHG